MNTTTKRSWNLLFSTVLVLAACAAQAADSGPAAASPPSAAPAAGVAAPATAPTHPAIDAGKPVDDASVYQLDSTWTRADGKKVKLESLRGKVRVLAIFYSSCQYACPIIVGRMKSIQAGLEESKDAAGFVLVSMDPGKDDPAHLRDYAKRMELEGDWTLMQGADGDVRELAALLGFRYRQEKDGGFAHSNMITVLDREGRIAYRSLGLDSDVRDAIDAVKKLVP